MMHKRNGTPWGTPFLLCEKDRNVGLESMSTDAYVSVLLWFVEAGRHQSSTGDFILSLLLTTDITISGNCECDVSKFKRKTKESIN